VTPIAQHATDSCPSLIPFVEEKITSFEPPAISVLVRAHDKWILASNLQKAIRRGLNDIACATANQLLQLDSRYFWRRLLVIAYEDIGYGNLDLCGELLLTFRREALHKKLGELRTAAYFISHLCNSIKSRSLCDAVCLIEFNPNAPTAAAPLDAAGQDAILSIASSDQIPFIYRMAAMRDICGYRIFRNGRFIQGAKSHPNLMKKIAGLAALSPLETYLFERGQSVSESLNIPIPLVSGMIRRSVQTVKEIALDTPGEAGILYCALDKHTRLGKRCIAELIKASSKLAHFFSNRPTLNPITATGHALFIIEGGVLDKSLDFDGRESLEQEFQRAYLAFAGLGPEDAVQLMSLVTGELDHLNEIRHKHLVL